MTKDIDTSTPEGRAAMLKKVNNKIQRLERQKETINKEIIELSVYTVILNELDGRQSKREFTITL